MKTHYKVEGQAASGGWVEIRKFRGSHMKRDAFRESDSSLNCITRVVRVTEQIVRLNKP